MEQHPGLKVKRVLVNGQDVTQPETDLGLIISGLDRAYKSILNLLVELRRYELEHFDEAIRCNRAFTNAKDSRNEISTLVEEFESNGVEII